MRLPWLIYKGVCNITNNKNLNDQCGVIKGTVACQTIKTFYIIVPLIHQIFEQIPNVKIVFFILIFICFIRYLILKYRVFIKKLG